MLSGTLANLACAPRRPEILSIVKRLDEEQGLAILRMDTYEGLTVDGVRSGRLAVQGSPWVAAVSPDGGCVAWVDKSSVPFTTQAGEQVIALSEGPIGSPRIVRFGGRFAADLAVSSKGAHVAILVVQDSLLHQRLITIGPGTAAVESDVTGLITRFSLADVETLRMSAAGNRMVVGSRELFTVIDPGAGKVVHEGQGRFPRISPQGDSLAFVDRKRALRVAVLAGGTDRTLMHGWTVPGVGSWSPNGRFLLAGARTSPSLFDKLVVVDTADDAFTEIMGLGEGNQGPRFTWIRRVLLAS